MRPDERSRRRTIAMLVREQLAKIIAREPVKPPPRKRRRLRRDDMKTCPSCRQLVLPPAGPVYVRFDEGHRMYVRLNCRCGCPFDEWIATEEVE